MIKLCSCTVQFMCICSCFAYLPAVLIGEFSLSISCSNCLSVCLSVGLCAAGYYCEEGSDSIQKTLCTTGHFCPQGTAVPYKCPEVCYNLMLKSRSDTTFQLSGSHLFDLVSFTPLLS